MATTANDISDIEIDRINRPRDPGRPLVTGDASVPELWRTNALAGGIAVAATIPLGAQGLVIVGSSLAVSYAYSVRPIRLSHRWTLAPLALALAYVVLPYALGVHIAGRGWDRRDVPLVGGLFVLFVARIVLKDLRDRLGDARSANQRCSSGWANAPHARQRLRSRARNSDPHRRAPRPALVATMLAIYGIGIV